MRGGITDWYVRLIDDPKTPTSIIPLEVIDRNGVPASAWLTRCERR